jgi:hypothetical protein
MAPCRILPAARFGREGDVLTAACDLGVLLAVRLIRRRGAKTASGAP